MQKQKHTILSHQKRQWGTEKSMEPLPSIHEIPSTRKIALSRIAIIATIFFWAIYILSTIIRQFLDGAHDYRFTMEAFSYAIVVSFLTLSALLYLIMRQGAFQRFSKHVRVPRLLLEKYFMHHQPTITVLVPSYSEEPEVIRKTLFSAALQEYPRKRVVLLIDDNPNPQNPSAKAKLEQTRSIPQELQKLLAQPYKKSQKALEEFEKSCKPGKAISSKVIKMLIKQYTWSAEWLLTTAKNEKIEDHVDVFFSEQVLNTLGNDLLLVAHALELSLEENAKISFERMHQLYSRLVWIFRVEIESFERKKYISLSHESNKAMNLNSYIGLMGGMYRKQKTDKGVMLLPTTRKDSENIFIPDSDYLLTLDADSVLLREYCLRLVYLLQQPENARVAVAQTPYSSFRGALSRIERLSGATTDLQHILHQGMTHYNATFWVGANAVIRKKAIEDIVETDVVNGFTVKRYVQDRTVIEDTESSIDLALHGWSLVNYPERLSYSATPPDWGSLVVQRRRWANGGLLILPKLWATVAKRRTKNEIVSRMEILIRVNYMASITWASFGGLFLLAFPYDGRLLSPLVLVAALPYFIAQAVDLKYCRYNYSDIFKIYGFNLMLLPVNLAGVIKSIEQALTGKKIPFARTPKIKNRTAASLMFVVSPLLIVLFSLFTVWRNINEGTWGNAIVAAFNAFATTWAICAYIGIDHLLADIWLGLTDWMYVDIMPKQIKVIQPQEQYIDWKSVLYSGTTSGSVPHDSVGEIFQQSMSKKGVSL